MHMNVESGIQIIDDLFTMTLPKTLETTSHCISTRRDIVYKEINEYERYFTLLEKK
jgi:hypothetical protein